jgi:hypothetical protein
MIFVSFFALGLFMVSISPTPINVQTIVLGNVLAITPSDSLQLIIIGAVYADGAHPDLEGSDAGVLRREPCADHGASAPTC